MIEALFIILYGLSFIGSAFMGAVWLRVALKGYWKLKPGEPLDTFCLIAIGLFLGAVANILIFGVRTYSAMAYGVDPSVYRAPGAAIIIAGLLTLPVSKGVLLWAHDPTHRAKAWRWFAAMSVVWVIAAPVWVLL